MHRRTVLMGLAAVGATAATRARAQANDFDALLAQLNADPSLVEGAWAASNHQNAAERSVGIGEPSTRRISQRAIDMIIKLEVSSQAQYESRYTHPIWPGGQSGVTIGIGYDLAFANAEYMQRDWGALVLAEAITRLSTTFTLRGAAAQQAVPALRDIVIPWDAACQQFDAFLPYPTAQAERIFPNSDKLSDDSFGALVSLVYNRGASIAAGSTRRREMRDIHFLMAEENFDPIPQKIRDMKHLWDPVTQRGLHIRRDLEASLFELGRT